MTEQASRYGEVIGDPVAHSKSPLIHRFWLDAAGIEADYRAHHVIATGLAGYLAERRDDPAWCGCNVTIPHKTALFDLIEDRGGVRDTIGAVNLVLRAEDGALIGTNTDVGGFYAPLAGLEAAGLELGNASVIVIGAGGAARAVLFALARLGVGSVTIVARDPVRAAQLLPQFGLSGAAVAIGTALPAAALLVNASPLGMTGQPPLIIDLSPLPADAIVYDIVYAPLETPLLAAAARQGLTTIDGLDMLIGQAALAFELLFDASPPREGDAELRRRLAA